MKQSFYYFLFILIVYLVYIFGAIDTIQNNWEFFLGGVGILGITWFFLNIFIIIFSTLVLRKWEELEKYAKSFCN